jgi:hypothetical protein
VADTTTLPPRSGRSSRPTTPRWGRSADALAAIDRAGFDLVDHFTVPDEAWWRDFYTPLQERVRDLRRVHASDPEALAVLDELDAEVEIHRRHGDSYAYEFFVTRRPA